MLPVIVQDSLYVTTLYANGHARAIEVRSRGMIRAVYTREAGTCHESRDGLRFVPATCDAFDRLTDTASTAAASKN